MITTVTGASGVRVATFGTKGARALVFPSGMAVILATPADCDEVIKAACAAKQDMPVSYRLSLTGFTVLAGNTDGAA